MRLGFLLMLAGCAAIPAADEFRERRLATVPEDSRLRGLAVFAEDGRVAYVERVNRSSRAICGDWTSRPFDLIC